MSRLPAAPAYGLIRRGCSPANLANARYAMAAWWAWPTADGGRLAQQTRYVESERGKPSRAHVQLQCCNVARISAPRDAARPKNSHLVDPIRGAEARPGVRVPVLWANFGLFGPQRPKACGFSLRGCCRPGAILPRGALMFLAEPGLAAAAAAAAGGGGAAALARAPDAAAR